MSSRYKIYDNKHDEINDFLSYKRNLGRSQRTLNAHSRVLQRFFHEHFTDLRPQDVEVQHIEEYLSILEERDVSQSTKKRYLESLSSFYSWALNRPRFEEINGNPASVVTEDIKCDSKDRPDCATWDNGKKIIQHITDPRNKMLAVTLAKTGCRLTEALSLRQDDLFLDEGFVRLRNRKGGGETVALWTKKLYEPSAATTESDPTTQTTSS